MKASGEGLYIIETSKKVSPQGITSPSQFLAGVHPLSERTAKYIDSRAFYCTIPKGKYILKAGQVCPYLFLLVKGVARGFIMQESLEITTWISAENELVSSISSFFNQTPSRDNIQALEDCEMIGLHFSDLEGAYSRFSDMNVAARKILQYSYTMAEDRAYLSRLPTAAHRYEYFAKTKPQLVSRVAQKIIASHLSMTLETLSRLRAAILKAPK